MALNGSPNPARKARAHTYELHLEFDHDEYAVRTDSIVKALAIWMQGVEQLDGAVIDITYLGQANPRRPVT